MESLQNIMIWNDYVQWILPEGIDLLTSILEKYSTCKIVQ